VKILPALLITLAVVGQFALVTPAQAEYRWVADSIYLPLRSGQGTQYRIIANLKTGTRLTLLSEDPRSEWVKVETASGTAGYVLRQHLLDTPTAAQQLAGTKTELESLRKQFNELKLQLDSSRSDEESLGQALRTSEQGFEQLQQQYDELKRISSNAVTLHERHSELLHSHEMLKTELEVLKAANARLQADARNTFFLYGVGAVLLGVVITLVVPHLRRRRRFSEWAN